jgi:hypothetical protein
MAFALTETLFASVCGESLTYCNHYRRIALTAVERWPCHKPSSSTKGIHIRMSCLNDIEFFNDNRSVQAGAGCTWDEIYKAVDAKGRIIVGGASDRGVETLVS